LAGDVGGTNARLAIVDVTERNACLLYKRQFASKEFPGLGPIIQTFLDGVAEKPDRASFGVACPVVNGACTMTNLSWTINAPSLAAETGIPQVELTNDFYALGHALPRLSSSDLAVLQPGEPNDLGVKALIGAGTGLGAAFVTWSGESYEVHASEGGHTSFSPTNDLESGLLATLTKRFGHVSAERVVSGTGIMAIYQHLAEIGAAEEQDSVRAEMERSDPAAVISRHALAGTDPLSESTLAVFTSAYGGLAGDLALTLLATGGVYVAGGIAPRIVPQLLDGGFLSAFRAKGRLSEFLSRIPVNVIVNPDVGLIGAAAVALRRWPSG
jgi:glucokinase